MHGLQRLASGKVTVMDFFSVEFENWMRFNCTGMRQKSELLRFLRGLQLQSEQQNKYSKPMVWIGIYIAIASLFCILPILADLLHGLKNKKYWFPCKYFTLNAASLTVIAVAMKLPMDLNNSMPGQVDQVAKLGSMAFMCTMMANLLPSLENMDSKELLTNIIALGVLVITLVVNIGIQLVTGVVSNYLLPSNYIINFSYNNNSYSTFGYNIGSFSGIIAILYVAMLLALLMIYACSALMILKSKQILDSRYKAGHETTLKDVDLQQPTVEKLKQYVSNHWIMAETGSPQFTAVCFAASSASGVICVSSTALHVIIMILIIPNRTDYGSDYKSSVVAIFITQFIGVLLGTIAPFSRCFASLRFEVSIKWIWNHIGVFKVESYCTQKLYDWKQSSIPLKFSSRRCKCFFQDLKILTMNICIKTQKTVVIACKMIALIPIFFVIGVLCCVHFWNWIKVMLGASNSGMLERPVQIQHNRSDLSPYILQLQDDMEIAERTLKSISKSVNYVIQKAEKQKPNNLMKLLEKSSGFEGVGQYDVHQVPPLLEEKYMGSWSLPVVTLTAIIISLPNIQKDNIDKLLRAVSEGLTYVTHVEETLNSSEEYAIIQKVARTLWLEVEVYHKWLGNKVQNLAHDVNTPKEIVQWFSDTAENIVTENLKGSDDSSFHKTISASSMYRITQTMLYSHDVDIDQVSHEELFGQLSSKISCILAACLTNLPQVITTKCHTNVIEKREASVHTAAQLLGETMQIINSLQDRNLPSLNPNDLPFIEKWRDCFLHPSP